MKKMKMLIPFLLLFALLGMLCRELLYAKPSELPSTLVGEDIPAFKLSSLYTPQEYLTPNKLQGQVTLLNVWASWCYACSIEAPMLSKISEKYHVPIYSIVYKDNPDDAKQWLNEHGNPFIMTGDDRDGDAAIDLGVYGTPETFVINKKGKIIYRHIGAITQRAWDTVLYPMILRENKA